MSFHIITYRKQRLVAESHPLSEDEVWQDGMDGFNRMVAGEADNMVVSDGKTGRTLNGRLGKYYESFDTLEPA